ncbi:MAG: MerR family transcriptional regulator [Anaerolineales bacterium]|jgi:effector-binding domain-containing protein|nr:MerR family transcriptional regulator [Anaerolineales bacterium]
MLKIGDFSKLCQVPIKTLRYYDQIGLLRPSEVDRFTSYRYYTLDQIPRLNRILAFKDLGFSLEQIAELLDEDLSVEQIRGMLRLKRAEIARNLAEEQARLARVEARLRQIEQEKQPMPAYEIVIKKVEALRVAGLRDVAENYQSLGPMFGELYAAVGQNMLAPAGPTMAIYYDEGYREKDVDVEVAVPISGNTDISHPRVRGRTLPGAEVASLLYRGPYDDFTPAYQALMGWMQANGYTMTGPNREIYLRGPGEGIAPEDYLTEIQFPVEKG